MKDKALIPTNRGHTMTLFTGDGGESAENEIFIAMHYASENAGKGGHFNREDIEELTNTLTQWLKENPVKVEKWVNIYHSRGDCTLYGTHERADAASLPDRIACIPISYHIGQGLTDEGDE